MTCFLLYATGTCTLRIKTWFRFYNCCKPGCYLRTNIFLFFSIYGLHDVLLPYDLFALYLKMILSVRLSAINSQGCIRKSEEKKELLGTAKSRQWPSDFVVMFAFYQLNCKNISFDTLEFAVALWYCDTDQFEGYPSLGFIFSIFHHHINHQQHYLSFEGERYRSRKCDFKCFSNVIKTAYINDKKTPLMLILLYLVRHFAHPCFNYSDITSIPKNEQKQWINCPLA